MLSVNAWFRQCRFESRHKIGLLVTMTFTSEQIGPKTWKIVEADPYGQFPFVYVRMGVDKCVVIGR